RIFDYPGQYGSHDEGEKYVRLRAEEAEVSDTVAIGESGCRSFAAGHRFTLTDNDREDQNQDYLLIKVAHEATQRTFHTSDPVEFKYLNRFTCIPAATPYRPPRVTPKPAVRGTQTAIVVGPDG